MSECKFIEVMSFNGQKMDEFVRKKDNIHIANLNDVGCLSQTNGIIA